MFYFHYSVMLSVHVNELRVERDGWRFMLIVIFLRGWRKMQIILMFIQRNSYSVTISSFMYIFSLKPQQVFIILIRRSCFVHVTTTEMDKNMWSLTSGSCRTETFRCRIRKFSLLFWDYNLKIHPLSNCHWSKISPLKFHPMVASYSNATKTKNYIITYILKLYYYIIKSLLTWYLVESQFEYEELRKEGTPRKK